MTAPANWPTDRLVYPSEAFRLAAQGLGLQPVDGYEPSGGVTVRDANGKILSGVVACCEATGEVIHYRLRDGQLVPSADGVQTISTSYPAPLQITYGEPSQP